MENTTFQLMLVYPMCAVFASGGIVECGYEHDYKVHIDRKPKSPQARFPLYGIGTAVTGEDYLRTKSLDA